MWKHSVPVHLGCCLHVGQFFKKAQSCASDPAIGGGTQEMRLIVWGNGRLRSIASGRAEYGGFHPQIWCPSAGHGRIVAGCHQQVHQIKWRTADLAGPLPWSPEGGIGRAFSVRISILKLFISAMSMAGNRPNSSSWWQPDRLCSCRWPSKCQQSARRMEIADPGESAASSSALEWQSIFPASFASRRPLSVASFFFGPKYHFSG